MASVLSIGLLGLSALCSSAAGRDHLSPWWVPAYASLFTSFALVALSTANMS